MADPIISTPLREALLARPDLDPTAVSQLSILWRDDFSGLGSGLIRDLVDARLEAPAYQKFRTTHTPSSEDRQVLSLREAASRSATNPFVGKPAGGNPLAG